MCKYKEYVKLLHQKTWLIEIDLDLNDFKWNKTLSRWEYIEPVLELTDDGLTFYSEKTYYLSDEEYKLVKEIKNA